MLNLPGEVRLIVAASLPALAGNGLKQQYCRTDGVRNLLSVRQQRDADQHSDGLARVPR